MKESNEIRKELEKAQKKVNEEDHGFGIHMTFEGYQDILPEHLHDCIRNNDSTEGRR